MSYCKGCHKEYYQKYYLQNRDVYKERAAKDFQDNKEAYYTRKYKYRAKVKGDTTELTPAEKKRIEDIYWLARDIQITTGEPYEVDHIIPISKGGKHHPDNLQVLPRDVNRSKGANL